VAALTQSNLIFETAPTNVIHYLRTNQFE